MTSRKTFEQLSKVYYLADETNRKQCGLYAECATCRYAVLPKDFEEHGYKAFCFLKLKE